MALKFLNKKGWHTGSLRNIENVWKAEQKHEAEQRKLEELQKQIREEQEHLEFRKLQEQAGLVPRQERLDFLYESGLGVGKPSSEEYLLGKPLEESKDDNVIQQVAAAPGSLFVEEKISANDQWRKIRSDPLLLIKQQELAARERIKNNPLKMEALRKEVELKKREKQEKKRLKAEEKKKRKELKKKMRMREDDEGVQGKEFDGGHHRKRERYESPASDEDGRGKRRCYGEGSSSRHLDSEDRRDSPERERKSEDEGDRRSRFEVDKRDRSPRRDRDRDRDRDADRRSRDGQDKYNRSFREEGNRDKEREHGERAWDERSRNLGKPPLPRKKVQLTEEEKMARLKEMQEDAELHEEQRWQRIKKASMNDALQEEKDTVKLSKNFLDQANRRVYGTEDGGNVSVADTLHRRSHYREKFTDKNAFRRS